MRPLAPGADRRLPPVDAVVVGLGWAGGILAAELTRAGLQVAGLERGPDRRLDGDEFTRKHDELRFRVRGGLMQDPAQETWTLRHDLREKALPIRRAGAFQLGTGVGGSSVHYGGAISRYAPWDFELRTRTLERYGPRALPRHCTVQDWGITYEDLEPCYDRFERVAGVAGRAGNLRGRIRPGGNPFEGPRSAEYPLPPPDQGASAALFERAATAYGLHPFPSPVAIQTAEYTNPDGISRGACTYCGDCEFHACAVEAKGDARVTVLPVAMRTGRLSLRTGANVLRILHQRGRAAGVIYREAGGAVVEQPAGLVVLAAYALNNVRLLLLSGLGEPYDPITGRGLVGRNYGYNISGRGVAFLRDRRLHKYMGAAAAGMALDDFAADNFDHARAGFVGGAQLASVASGAPISGIPLPPGTPSWGPRWKLALRDWYDRALAISLRGSVLAYRTSFLDLDPTYRDAWGSPLLRITFDWQENERRVFRHATARIRELLASLGPDALSVPDGLDERFDTVRYQNSHNTGGAVMGADPATSVVNPHLQMWDCENVWVVGGSAFPQTGATGPTGTIGALAYRAADAIVRRYLRRQGALA